MLIHPMDSYKWAEVFEITERFKGDAVKKTKTTHKFIKCTNVLSVNKQFAHDNKEYILASLSTKYFNASQIEITPMFTKDVKLQIL